MSDDSSRQVLNELLKSSHTGLLATVQTDGKLVSRPMALQASEFDGDLWFFTGKDSDKTQEITNQPQVNVSFESKGSWVSLSGTASVLDDREKAKELWNPIVKAYFPGGLDDPNLRLIKVHADSAEYWDTDSKLVQIFGMAKGAITGQQPDISDNQTVEL